MTNIILVGCNGKMGQVICRLVENDPEARIVCGVDISGEKKNDFPVYTEFNSEISGDAIIDLSLQSQSEYRPLWRLPVFRMSKRRS